MNSMSLVMKYSSLKSLGVVPHHLSGTVTTRESCFITFLGKVKFLVVELTRKFKTRTPLISSLRLRHGVIKDSRGVVFLY